MSEKLVQREVGGSDANTGGGWGSLESVPFGQGVEVMGMSDNSEAYNRNVEFSPDNTKEYWKFRAQDNFDLLQSKNPDLAQVYANVVNENRRLATIKLTDIDIKCNAHFNRCGRQDGQYVPEVAFNLSNIETYIEPSMGTLLKQISIQMGARYEDIKNNQKLVSAFILLHEVGHGADFIENFLKPDENRGKSISDVLGGAVKASLRKRLQEEMSRPIPGHVDISKKEDRKKFSKRLEAFGINRGEDGKFSGERIRMAQNIAYREMPSEYFADSFARGYIERHRDEYFLPAGVEDDGSGRIKTGEKISMDEEEIILSGIRDGKSITLTKVAQTGESGIPVGYSDTGFMLGQLEVGRGIQLVQDVYDENMTRTSDVVSVERQLRSDGKNTFTVKTASGAVYEITKNLDKKQKQIPATVEEMKTALGLGAGSEVVLMKRSIQGGGRSGIDVGKVMDGKLRHEPRMGSSIELEGPGGGITTPVEEVRRIWRSWRFRTSSGSVYEIIPGE